MGRDERQLRRMRGEALSRLLQGLTYGGCLVIFYALMAIPNWPLRNLSRTSATTLVTWVAMGAAMLAVFGRMTVRRGKHQQQAAGQCMGVLITDAVTYLQLQIMNVNPNNRTHLTLFGADFAYLLIAAALQMALVAADYRGGCGRNSAEAGEGAHLRAAEGCLQLASGGIARVFGAERCSAHCVGCAG